MKDFNFLKLKEKENVKNLIVVILAEKYFQI